MLKDKVFIEGRGWVRRYKTAEYRAWRYMRARINFPNNKYYSRYGGRGITICQRWGNFENFLADMGPKPSNRHSLDRIDNDGNYEPGNCRWATPKQQVSNTCRTHFLRFNGRKMPAKDWAKEMGINYLTLLERLQRGWSVEDALTRPVR